MSRIIILLFFATFVALAQATGWGKEHFFQYANVPGWNQYEFGYNRGNDKHFISRFEKAHGWTFKTKVRWGDKNGWGESYWDYNHNDKGHKKGGWGWKEEPKHHGWGHGGHGGHGGQHGSGSENVQQLAGSSNEEVYQPTQRPSVQTLPTNYAQHYPQIKQFRN